MAGVADGGCMIEYICLGVLQCQDQETLIRWFHVLNRFQWPNELPLPEEAKYISGGRRGQILEWIKNRIGHRTILRDHNKEMTDAQFDDFWRGCFMGDIKSLERYYEWLRNSVEEKSVKS